MLCFHIKMVICYLFLLLFVPLARFHIKELKGVHAVHPTVNKLTIPVTLSLKIASVQYRWHNSHLNNVSSKGLCWCKCIYRQMGVCTFTNSMFSPTGRIQRKWKHVQVNIRQLCTPTRGYKRGNNEIKNGAGELYVRLLHNQIHNAILLSFLERLVLM